MSATLKLFGLFCVLLASGCVSQPVKFETPPLAPHEEVIGPVESSSTGIMLFQFIPINQNDRFQKAYDYAVQKSGGTRLIDVEISERWFWAWVLNGYIFKVSGTAVRGTGTGEPATATDEGADPEEPAQGDGD